MPDFSRDGRSADNEPSLDDIRRSDNLVDALAAGGPVVPEDPADAALAALLGGWRDEMRWPPATGLISEPQAIAALDAGLAEKPGGLRRDKRADKQIASVTPMRNRRGLSVLGAAAAAVLGIGGFVALYQGPTQVREDDVVLAARTELEQVQELITQGQWQQAQEKLVAVSTQVASIGDEQQKQDLFDDFNDLSAKVVEQNPEATAAPGIIYTVPPAANELVPAVAPPTSVPIATSPSDSTSATSTSGEQTSTSGSTTSGSPGTTPTSGAPTSSQSPAASSTPTTTRPATPTTTPTSAAPVTTSAPAASSSASSSPSAAQATSSAAVTTTSAAPRGASSTTASSPVSRTSAAPTSAAAPTTTTTPPAAPAQASTTTAQAPVSTTAAPAEDPSQEAQEESVPTTTAVPIPVTTTTVPVAAG